jgi:hypothetical protein
MNHAFIPAVCQTAIQMGLTTCGIKGGLPVESKSALQLPPNANNHPSTFPFPLSPSRPTAANIMRTSMLLASLTSLLAVPAALGLSVPRTSSVQFTFSNAPAVGACGSVYKDSDNVSTSHDTSLCTPKWCIDIAILYYLFFVGRGAESCRT